MPRADPTDDRGERARGRSDAGALSEGLGTLGGHLAGEELPGPQSWSCHRDDKGPLSTHLGSSLEHRKGFYDEVEERLQVYS